MSELGDAPPVVAEATVAVRNAGAGDRAAVEALLSAAELPTQGVEDQLEHGFVVAELDRAIVGAAGLETYGSYALLRSVVVRADVRGHRVGEALVRERLDWAASRGVRSVYLLTTTAASFFDRLGFETVSRDVVPAAIRRSGEYAEICAETATVMSIQVPAADSGCGCDPSCCGPTSAAPPVSARRGRATEPSRGSTAAAVRRSESPAELVPLSFEGSAAEALKAQVRERYGAAASRAASGAQSSCCGASPAGPSSCCGASADEVWDPITSDLYEEAEKQGLPAEAVLASLGCGNPTALAQLNPGETVLDLGSGGGIDVLLSARRVGPTGKAYGLDMTDEMLALARQNQERAGAHNVEFLKGDIESIPLPDASVDVIISNCVINLAANKPRVLREAFRVLRPGGRFAVSDVVARRDVPAPIRRSMELWMGCVAGALEESEYAKLLGEAGFTDISLEPTRIYHATDAQYFLEGAGIAVADGVEDYDGAFMSAFVRASKPTA